MKIVHSVTDDGVKTAMEMVELVRLVHLFDRHFLGININDYYYSFHVLFYSVSGQGEAGPICLLFVSFSSKDLKYLFSR